MFHVICWYQICLCAIAAYLSNIAHRFETKNRCGTGHSVSSLTWKKSKQWHLLFLIISHLVFSTRYPSASFSIIHVTYGSCPPAVPLGVAPYNIALGSTCCSIWCRPKWYCSRIHMSFHLASPIWCCFRLHILFYFALPHIILFQARSTCRLTWYPHIILLHAPNAVPLCVTPFDTVPGSSCCLVISITHLFIMMGTVLNMISAIFDKWWTLNRHTFDRLLRRLKYKFHYDE